MTQKTCLEGACPSFEPRKDVEAPYTSDLAYELQSKDSVITLDVGPEERTTITVPGPAKVLIVLD